jgi:hypothetical protein
MGPFVEGSKYLKKKKGYFKLKKRIYITHTSLLPTNNENELDTTKKLRLKSPGTQKLVSERKGSLYKSMNLKSKVCCDAMCCDTIHNPEIRFVFHAFYIPSASCSTILALQE